MAVFYGKITKPKREGIMESYIRRAIYNKDKNTLKEILSDESVNINKMNEIWGDNPILCCVENGNAEMLDMILERKDVDVNVQQIRTKCTPLILAVIHGQFDMAKSLLKRPEINVNIKDIEGKTAIMYAAQIAEEEIFSLILKKAELDFSAKDKKGKTVYDYAKSRFGYFSKVANVQAKARIIEKLKTTKSYMKENEGLAK